jgi:hypothetical protein
MDWRILVFYPEPEARETFTNIRQLIVTSQYIRYSNMTFFFRFVDNRANYPFRIISLAHAPVNVTEFSI